MRYISGLAFGAGIALSGAALAQSNPSSLGGGLYYSGFVELSYVVDGTDTDTLTFAEIDMGMSPNAGGSGIPIGFSLGIDAFSIAGTDQSAFYPAVTFGLGSNGLISLGAPRSVLDTGYTPQNTFAGVSIVDLDIAIITDPFLSVSALFSDVLAYGVRYDGEFGNLKLGASYNTLDDGGLQLDAYAIAFSYALQTVGSFPELVFFGGAERMDAGSGSGTSYSLGAEARSDMVNASIAFKDSGALLGDVQSTILSGDYKITDALTASASALLLRSGGTTDEFYGISLGYQLASGAYADIGAVDSGIFSDPIYEASIGWRF